MLLPSLKNDPITGDSPISSLGEVFVSYSWDNEEHIKAVLALSNRLRADGIDCVLDQYEVSPHEGWPRWMDRKIATASLVLVICTQTYYERVMGRESPDKGHGVKWEGNIIYQHLYNQGADNQKFIPVLMQGADRNFIPIPLQGASFFPVDNDAGYERLYNRLLGRAPAEKPPLGERRALPQKEVKTDFVAYVASPIDVALWNKARWCATAFQVWSDRVNTPPVIGIAYLNKDPAEKIFEQWRRRYGKRDIFEELRISIIEGDVPGEPPGYTVHIGIDFENVLKRYRDAGLSVEDGSFLGSVSRLNRMTPPPGSPNLPRFKEAFRKHGEYLLVPATCNPDGSNLQFAPVLAIQKRVLYLRNTVEIGKNDIDSVVLQTGSWKRPLTAYGRSVKKRAKTKPK